MKLKFTFIALVAMLSSFAFTANAQQNVAKVGNTEYATINEAINAWTSGTTLTLLADVTLTDVVKINSNESRTLDLGTFTMTAASGKDAFQYVLTGSTSDVGLSIKADATNPGGINASGKAIIRHTKPLLNAPSKDRPYTQFFGGVFNASYIVYQGGTFGAGYTGASAPRFVFHGGEFNGTIYANRSKFIFNGGTFNGNIQISVDSSADALVKGGKFKNLSNSFGSELNSDKFTIGSSAGTYDREVYVDENGYYVISASEPAEGIEADVAKTPGKNDYFAYSKVATDGQLGYTDVEMALKNNTSATVTVYTDEVDMTGINFSGTIIVPEGNDITITNAPSTLKVQLADGTVLTPDANGNVTTVLPVAQIGEQKYATLDEAITAAQSGEKIILLADVELTAQVVIPEGKELTLDLNGKTVNSVFNGNSTTNHIYALSNKGTLTINDSKGNGSINSRGIYNYGSLTLNAGAINAIDGNGGYAVNNQNGSTFVMNGGVVAATYEDDHQSSSGGYDATALKVPAGCTATLNGGTINNVCDFTYAIDAAGTLNIPETSAITVNGTHGAIYVSGGETTINAGTFQIPADEYTRTDNVLYVSGGSLVVNGGTFIGDSDTASGGSCLSDAAGKAVVNGGTFKGSSGGDVWGTTGTTIKGGTFENLTEKQHIAEGYELNADGTVVAKPVAEVNGVKYASFVEAAAAAQAGSEIKLLANIEGDITVPAGVIFNGNGFAVSGAVTAAGEITFAGVTKVGNFGVQYVNTTVNIPAGASLQLTGTGRMVIGHGCIFNITGTIADAKTANVADVTPSLLMPGASFTGAGVTFNVTNAYISAPSSYCSSSKSASGIFDFNITNSIWESAGKLAFESQSTAATVNFGLENSVLNTGSHLVFGVSRGEVVIDNSNVNVGKSYQIENHSTMTIKNGSVVNGAVATSSNAKNPGTIIVENATYAVTGEFSGSDLGTGTLIIKKGATVSAGSITKANITIDATDMVAGDEVNLTANLSNLAGTLSVINNDKLEAKIVDGKVVLAAKPVAKIGEQGYATLEEAFAAATEGQTITLLDDATPALASQRAITKAAVIDLGGKTMTLTEDDLYFGTTTFKNGTIIVDPSVKPSTAVFWMFANQTLTFDNVKIVATGVTGTYLIGLEGENSDLNLLNGSEILVENTTALDLDIICVNGTNTCDIKVENSKVNVTNLDGRVFFRGNYTVKDSEVNLAGITKAGFRIEAGQTLSIEGTSNVTIAGEPRDGGIHITDLSATYTKAETATVNATVNEPKVAKVGENTYRTLAQAVAAVEDGGTITLIANETFTKTNRTHNSGTWYDGLYYVGDKSFTIDLGGFTISQDGAVNDYLLNFKNSGSKANTITLKNGTIDAGTAAFCAICTSSSQANELTINTEDINIINNISNGSTIKLRGGAVLNVKDGTKITGKNSYLGIECVASTVNIYDGAEIYMNGTSSYNGCLVGACGGGTVNVYGGYGKGVKGGFIAMTSGGTINISGGEWIANTDGTVGNNSNLYVLTAQSNKYESGFVGASIINVTGGTLRGGMDAWVLNNLEGEKAELNISGGNFNANPTKFVEDDYIAVENNGVWNVVKAAAKIGKQGYATIKDAVAAVKESETITILAGTHSEGTVKLPATLKNVTIKGAASVARSTEETILKDMTISAADGNSYSYVGLTFDDITFDNSRILLTGWRNGEEKIENLTVTNCTFKNLNDNTNTAPIHINKDASEAVNGFTFTNNVIDGATGGSKSGIYAQVTGEVKVENNIINNVSFRPYVIQVTTDDGIADNFTVKGNTFSGSAVGRAQGLGNNAEGTDNVNLVVSNNIFKGITDAQQICYWNFNPETTTADLSKNYYDIDIVANPSKIYFNSSAADNYALRDMNVFPIYKELNEDGTINTESAFTPKFYIAKVGENSYETLAEAVAAAQTGDEIVLIADVKTTDGVVITDKNLTIDLNGKTYTVTEGASTNNRNFKINGASVVTVKNGTMVAAGEYSSGAYGTIRTEGTANVTLTGLKLYNYRGNGLNIKACAGTTVTVENTEIYANYGGGIESAGGTIVVNNGVTVEQKGMYTAPYNSMAISVNGGGKVTVNGGTFSTECITAEEANNQGTSHGPWVAGVLNSGGTLIINGGTFSNDNFGENSLATYARGAILADTKAKVEINGGTFNVLKNVIDIQNNLGDANNNPSVVLAGGTYNADPRISAQYGSNLITLADGYMVEENNGIYTVEKAAAKIGEQAYKTLEDAFKAATSGCTIEILSDVIVDYYWDARNTGAKFTVPVTINGNGNTIKFTNTVYDGGNYMSAFRFEADAVVNNLTIDMSEAISGFAGRFRAISAKANLTVDGCTFIGNGYTNNTRAIIFGEGASATDLTISITNSTFNGWRRGISDNEAGKDVAATVTVTGNTLTDAGVAVSANTAVAFTGNTVSGAYVDIRSYTTGNSLNVTATGNTLEANTDKSYNYIKAGGDINAQDEFVLPTVAISYNANGDEVAAYSDFESAIAAASANTDIVRIEVVADYHQKKIANVENYYDIKTDLVIASAEDNNYTLKGCGFAVRVQGNVTFTIAENLTIEGLDVVANGFATSGENMVVDGTLKAVSLKQWTSNGTITVNGKVELGYGDGQFDMAYGNGAVVVNGNGDRTVAQFKAGYSGARGNGGVLTLNDTYFEAGAWFNVNGSNTTINVNNSLLKVTGGDFVGALTLATSNVINIDINSQVVAGAISGAGTINIDADGFNGEAVTVIKADMSGFTGEINVAGEGVIKEMTAVGVVIKADPNYIAEFVMDDANSVDYTFTEEKYVGTLIYKRTLIEGIWNPLYLPFEIDVEELVENYDIAYYNQMHSYDSDNNGSFDSYEMEVARITSGTLRANYPYFIRPKSAENCNLEYVANDVTLQPALEKKIITSSVANIFTLSGTHKAMGKSELAGYYAISVDGDWSATASLKAHRLYLKIEENDNSPFATSAAKSIRIVVRGEGDGTTGVEDVTTENEVVEAIYDINGRRVLDTEKGGLYIINGKKVLVK